MQNLHLKKKENAINEDKAAAVPPDLMAESLPYFSIPIHNEINEAEAVSVPPAPIPEGKKGCPSFVRTS